MVLLALLTEGPRLLAAAANQLAVWALLPEWEEVGQEIDVPRCTTRVETSAASAYLQTALAWDPAYQRALFNSGRVAWLQGACSEARARWAEAMTAAPDDQVAAFWLFWAAGAGLENLSESLPAGRLAQYARQVGLRDQSQGAEDAIVRQWYELVLLVDPDRDTGERLASLYPAEQAAAMWERMASQLLPENPDHWWALGQAAESEKAWREAAYAYGRGGEISGAPRDFWMQQARAFQQLGQSADEEQAYYRAISACAECVDPYVQLGHFWRRSGELGQALAWYEEAGRVKPENWFPPYYQAEVWHSMGADETAVALLERAIALHTGKPWMWSVQLGDWRLELGDREGAVAAYRQAQVWQPDEESIRKRLERANY